MKRTTTAIFVLALAVFSLHARQTLAATDWKGRFDQIENRIIDDAIVDYGEWDDLAGHRNDLALDVPILAYHQIREFTANEPRASRRFVTTPETFALEMNHLSVRGYTVVSLSSVVSDLENKRALPTHPVVITFDDGFENQYLSALPVLETKGYPATFFLIAGAIGRAPGAMTEKEVSSLASRGMEIGAHTMTHPDLSLARKKVLDAEIGGSRAALAKLLGTPPTCFAYPYGKHDTRTVAAVEAAGFDCAVGVVPGRRQYASERFTLRRYNIDDDYTVFLNALGER